METVYLHSDPNAQVSSPDIVFRSTNEIRPLDLSELPYCPPPIQSQELKLALDQIETQKKLINFLEKELQFLMNENVRIEAELQKAEERLEKAG